MMRATALAAAAIFSALSMLAIEPASAQDAAKGEMVCNKCKVCHRVGDGARNNVGPVLNNVFGRQAGTVEGFAYSPLN